jgi:diadenosine tetraphosphatase ApaH/serine/threonine PP2A family protein phosphatase
LHPDFNIFAASALKLSIDNLSINEKRILYNLPPMLTFYQENPDQSKTAIQMVHGSPEYPLDYYVFNGSNGPSQDQLEIAEFMELCELDILFMGHTHKPFIREINNRTLVNPGSTGQPRDGDPRASYAVFDPFKKVGIIERVSYDFDTTIQLTGEAELPKQLGNRLRRGK